MKIKHRATSKLSLKKSNIKFRTYCFKFVYSVHFVSVFSNAHAVCAEYTVL